MVFCQTTRRWKEVVTPTPQNHTILEDLFIISLKRSKEDRLNSLLERIREKGVTYRITIIEAVDGKELRNEDNPNHLNPGTLGCHLSHIKALETAKQMHLPCVLIIEDDIDFVENFTEKLNEYITWLPKDWAAMWLGGVNAVPMETFSPQLYKLVTSWGAFAYIIPQSKYDYFITGLTTNKIGADNWYKKAHRRTNCYRPTVDLVKHIGLPSTRGGEWQKEEPVVFDVEAFNKANAENLNRAFDGFKPTSDNYVCSIYLNKTKYRYGKFPPSPSIKHLEKWALSLKETGLRGVMFHNCLTDAEIKSFDYPVDFIRVEIPPKHMSGLYRYFIFKIFLERFEIKNAWLTDSTDLDVLKNPFIQDNYQSDKIYIGSEPVVRNNKWMLQACHGYDNYLSLVKRNKEFANGTLLNAGLIGGNVKTIKPMIDRLAYECSLLYPVAAVQDMSVINYIAFTEFWDKVSYGPHLNTVFTAYEKDNKTAWFRHK